MSLSTTIKVGIIDSDTISSSPNHRSRMQQIIQNQVRKSLGDSIIVEFVNIEADRDQDGQIQLSEYNECFVEAGAKNFQYLCLAQEIEVDRDSPGAESALREVDSNLNNLSRQLGNHLFVSAGNNGLDNYFAHTRGVTVVGADRPCSAYTDPAQYRSTADRIINKSPIDPYSHYRGTSEATALALSEEIINDYRSTHPNSNYKMQVRENTWWGKQLWEYLFG